MGQSKDFGLFSDRKLINFSNENLINQGIMGTYLYTKFFFLLLGRELIINDKEGKQEGMNKIGLLSRNRTNVLVDWIQSKILSN